MKKLVILMFFVSHSLGFTFAQTAEIDSLKKQLLINYKEDTSRVITLVALSNAYCYFKPDTFMLLSLQAYSLAKQINFIRGEIASLTNIGVAYSMFGNYPKALEAALRNLEMCEKTNDKKRIFNALTNIGYIYTELGDYPKALDYIHKSKVTAIEIQNENNLAMAFVNLGDIYLESDQLDSAFFYTEKGCEICLRLNLTDLIGIALNNLGSIYSKKEQNELAMDYYRQCIPFYKEINDDEGICIASFGIAELFLQLGQKDSSLSYARHSLSIAQTTGLTSRVLDASVFLADYYKNLDVYDSAFVYQEITIAAKDSLFSQEKMRQVETLSINEMVRQQEIIEAKSKAEKERKNNLQLIGIAIFIIIFVLFVIAISSRKVKPRLIEILGIIALLLLFEFISLLIDPYVANWTHQTPIYMMLILVGIAAILGPSHHRLEKWMKSKLIEKKPVPADNVPVNEKEME
ncbi:MAG: tetratricopeptide repeat protein [Bacteroidota bacterium]